MSPTLLWLSAVLGFLIIEMLTTTLYGSVVALGCLAAALMAYFMGGFHWMQVIVCLVVVIAGSILIPRFFRHTGTPLRMGLDAYIGKKAVIKIVDSRPKITLDGVEYLVEADDQQPFANQTVTIIGRDGSIIRVR